MSLPHWMPPKSILSKWLLKRSPSSLDSIPILRAMAAIAVFPSCGARRLNARPWLRAVRAASGSSASPSPSPLPPPSGIDAIVDAPSSGAAPPSRSFFPKRGQTLELVCESLAFKAKGICKAADSGFVLMCDRALPGERFLGRVSRKKDSYAEVTKLKTITPHWDAVEPPCQYASYCGGCKTQNLSYEAQIRAKEQQVRDLIVHVGRFSDKDAGFSKVMKSIVPCDLLFHYRNKMEFSFGHERWMPPDVLTSEDKMESGYALGLHAPGFFYKVLHVEKCLLQSEVANKVLAVFQDSWMDPELGLLPYNVLNHSGFLKHLMLRTGRDVKTGTPEVMVNFVTSSYMPSLLMPLVDKIIAFPEVVSVVNNVNRSVGNTSVGEEEYTLYGKSSITEMLRGLVFQISANSFFQTNSHQAEVLYKLVEDCARLRGDGSEIVLDLFCGTGSIGLSLAKRVKHVYGFEVVAEAVSDALRNAKLNGIENATFVQGDLNKISDSFGKDFPKPDIVITDPNRPGMHMKLIKYLLKLKAPRIVYVSCNPATLARDLDYLCHGVTEQGISGCYSLKSVQPVDMFPHTPHIECVCLLELS
ncbi:uncharacterized RNA methyltransferase CT0009-like isoform X1 [Zingiber officinale]|uniref:TRAM domain-containing protein n=2 Tax=Zingiber officinale TaxID=94328 RepID=A0A8J5G1U8_ZINOF|nr:uncharacterized RNA methyltransferase CT0009-like isoform X1 [Zingiber officinale]KAG6494472.1 hypothetical protein ZIOFF_049504 [Zingiber officinale]